MKLIYLDNNATTRVAPAVAEAMMPYFTEKYGNASSMYPLAAEAKKAMDIARAEVADLIGAAYPDEIIFTSCATESDNTAIFSAIRSYPQKKHIITSAVEHPAVLHPYSYLETQGYKVDYIGVDAQGRFNMEQYKKALDGDTALVSVMWVNSETGTIFPVPEIAALAKEYGALFHTDAVQAIGKLPFDVKNTPIDMLSLSAINSTRPKAWEPCMCGAVRALRAL